VVQDLTLINLYLKATFTDICSIIKARSAFGKRAMKDVTIDADQFFFVIEDHPPRIGSSPCWYKN